MTRGYDQLSKYELMHLPYHLAMAGRENPSKASFLAELLFDPAWLTTKLAVHGLPAVETDFGMLDGDEDAAALRVALRQSSLVVGANPSYFLQHLYARLVGVNLPKTTALCGQIVSSQSGPWLRPVISSIAGPWDPLRRYVDTGEECVYAADTTEDQELIVTIGARGIITVCEVASGRVLSTGYGPNVPTCAIEISKQGTHIVTGSDDGIVREWDLSSKRLVAELSKHDSPVLSVAASKDGRLVASGCWSGTAMVWDNVAKKPSCSLAGQHRWVTAVSWIGDSQIVLTASRGGKLTTWELDNAERVIEMQCGVCGQVCCTPLTPAGVYLIGGSCGGLEVWDVMNGKLIKSLVAHYRGIKAVAVSRDGRSAASMGDDRMLRLWDTATWDEGLCVPLDAENASAVAFCERDNTVVMTYANDSRISFVAIGRPATSRGERCSSSGIERIAISPDGAFAATGAKMGEVGLWSLVDGSRTLSQGWGILDGVGGVAFRSGRDELVTVSDGGVITVWSRGNLSPLHRLGSPGDKYREVALSPDGNVAYVGTTEGVEIWGLDEKVKLRSLHWGGEWFVPRAMLLADDGRRLLVAAGKAVYAWALDEDCEHRVVAQHDSDVRGMVMLPDAHRLVSAGAKGTIRVTDIKRGEQLRTIQAHSHELMAVALVTGSCRVVSASAAGTLRVWDTVSGEQILCIEGHRNVISSVATSSNGRWAVSASWDRSLRLWDLSTGGQVAHFYGDHAMRCCAISPDGTTVVGGDEGGHVHVLRAINLPVA